MEAIPAGLRVNAPAKINLDLLVGQPRGDGFHPIDSLAAKVTLYDTVDLRLRDNDRIDFALRTASFGPAPESGNPESPWDCGPSDRNLALRAAMLLKDAAGPPASGSALGADIELAKNIPPGSGLGGGSSDAAAVLYGLNQQWRLGFPPERLASLGSQLGSDVPLFLGPPGVRMTGRGEVIEPIQVYPFWAILVLPELTKSTAAVYRAFDELSAAEAGAMHASWANRQFDLGVLQSPPSMWRHLLRNDLADAAMHICPALRSLLERLVAQSRLPVCLTGAGTVMFILCDDRDEAVAVAGRLDGIMARQCIIVRHCGD